MMDCKTLTATGTGSIVRMHLIVYRIGTLGISKDLMVRSTAKRTQSTLPQGSKLFKELRDYFYFPEK